MSTAPTYQPPQAPAAAPRKPAGGTAKPVGSPWLQMADRRPTESTSALVNRQYGVPERQMGVNKGKVGQSRPERSQEVADVQDALGLDARE
jgi:hypothetical protein